MSCNIVEKDKYWNVYQNGELQQVEKKCFVISEYKNVEILVMQTNNSCPIPDSVIELIIDDCQTDINLFEHKSIKTIIIYNIKDEIKMAIPQNCNELRVNLNRFDLNIFSNMNNIETLHITNAKLNNFISWHKLKNLIIINSDIENMTIPYNLQLLEINNCYLPKFDLVNNKISKCIISNSVILDNVNGDIEINEISFNR